MECGKLVRVANGVIQVGGTRRTQGRSKTRPRDKEVMMRQPRRRRQWYGCCAGSGKQAVLVLAPERSQGFSIDSHERTRCQVRQTARGLVSERRELPGTVVIGQIGMEPETVRVLRLAGGPVGQPSV